MTPASADDELTAERLAAALLGAAEDLRAGAQAVGGDNAHRRPSPDEWSAAEIVAHAIEIQRYWLAETSKVIENPGCHFGRTKDDPARLAWVAEHGRRELDDLLAEFDREVQRSATELRGLGGAALDRVGLHHRRGEMTARQILHVWLTEHMIEHARQAEELTEPPMMTDGGERAPDDGGRDG